MAFHKISFQCAFIFLKYKEALLVHFINLLGFLFCHYAKIASLYSRII